MFSSLFYLVLIFKTTFELFLGLKNRRYMTKHSKAVPLFFRESISLEDHRKSIAYAMSQSHLDKWRVQTQAIFLLTLFPLLLADHINRFTKDFLFSLWGLSSPISQGILFFFMIGTLRFIIEIPFSYYRTFIIEEKFGFNKTTPRVFTLDLIKEIFLLLLLGAPILAGLIAIYMELGHLWWLWGWGAFSLFQLFIIWIAPIWIAPLFNRFTPLENEELKNQIQSLAQKTGFEMESIQVMDASRRSSHGNAYFTGFGKKKRIVFFDTLLKELNNQEIIAVLAHELGHFKKRHLLKSLALSLVISFFSFALMGFLSKIPAFYTGHHVFSQEPYMAFFIFFNVLPLYFFILSPLGNFLSRKNEFEADAFAAEYAEAKDLESALLTLQRKNQSCISIDPFYSFFYHSHPQLMERLQELKKLCKSSK